MSKRLEQIVEESKAQESAKAAKKAELDAKIKKMADAARAKQAAQKEEQRQRQEAVVATRQKTFDEELEREARQLFFAGNSGASEATWQSVREDFRKRVIVARSEKATRRSSRTYR